MKKIVAFAGSTSSTSINKQLVIYASSKLKNFEVDIIDLRDFSLPIYSIDEEKKEMPKDAIRFSNLFKQYDGIVLSLAEHNASYTAAFKNIFDWSSRVDSNVFQNRPMLLMAASPGARGGKSVLEAAENKFSRMGAEPLNVFSFPSFYDNFKNDKVINDELEQELNQKIAEFKFNLKQ